MTDLSNFVVERGFWRPDETPEQAIYRMRKDLRQRYGKRSLLILVEQFTLRAWEAEKRLATLLQGLSGPEDEPVFEFAWEQGLTAEEKEAMAEVLYCKVLYPEDVDTLARLCVESRETHVTRATPLPPDYESRLREMVRGH